MTSVIFFVILRYRMAVASLLAVFWRWPSSAGDMYVPSCTDTGIGQNTMIMVLSLTLA